MASKRIVVVTGGNKGIGFEICKQIVSSSHDHLVIVTARDEQKGLQSLDKLKTSGNLSENDVVFRQLDVTDPASIASFADFIRTHFGKLDILVNNAGINVNVVDDGSVHPTEDTRLKAYTAKLYEASKDCIQTNYYGTKYVTEALLPFLQLSSSPRIINVSTDRGKLENIKDERMCQILSDIDKLTEEVLEEVVTGFLRDMKDGLLEEKGWNVSKSAYGVSKAAMNAYTRILANKYPSLCINAVTPGWTKTDMTNYEGTYTVEEGARGPVWLALMSNDGPTGCSFFQTEEATF